MLACSTDDGAKEERRSERTKDGEEIRDLSGKNGIGRDETRREERDVVFCGAGYLIKRNKRKMEEREDVIA